MQNLFNKLFDNITISQEVWNTAAALTFHDTHSEWYGMLIGKVELTPNKSNPLVSNIKIVAEKILIPKQKVTSGDVQIDQTATAELMTDEVLTSMREKNQRVIGWIHSHAGMSVFLSGTDMSNINDELAMLPLTLSIVVAYSPNSEYHPEPKDTPAPEKVNAKKLDEVLVFHLRSNKRKRVMKAFWKTNLLTKTSFKELQKVTKKAKDWRVEFIKFLKLYGIIVVDDRADKSVNKGLDSFIGSRRSRSVRDEFHMGIWFSHRSPFSERKMTSNDLAQYEKHKIITWPEKMPRHEAELEKLLTDEVKEEIKMLITRIQPKHGDWGRPTTTKHYPRFGRRSGITIAPEYLGSVAASISRTNHLPDHVRPQMPSPIRALNAGARFRSFLCPFCSGHLQVETAGACYLCDETEDVRMDLISENAHELGMSYEQVENNVDLEEDARFKEEVQTAYNSGACAECSSSVHIEMYCFNCDLGLEIGSESNQSEVEGQLCIGCDNQLLYVHHIFDNQRDYVGFICACEACENEYVYNYGTGELIPSNYWLAEIYGDQW